MSRRLCETWEQRAQKATSFDGVRTKTASITVEERHLQGRDTRNDDSRGAKAPLFHGTPNVCQHFHFRFELGVTGLTICRILISMRS